jgi:hypothetical protein
MALVYIDGFEEFNTSTEKETNLIEAGAYWNPMWGSPSTTTIRTQMPSGAGGRSWSVSGFISELNLVPVTEIFVGFGGWTNAASLNNFLDITNAAGNGIRFRRTATGAIEVVMISGGASMATSAVIMALSQWRYIEIRVKIHATAGEIQVRVEGTEVINLTNQNTTVGTVADFRKLRFWVNNSTFLIDDLYVCDASGATNNTFLGPVTVYTLVPNGAGATTQFTPTGAASNWDCVNEIGGPDTTTYVASSTTGHIDYYAVEDIPGTVTAVHGVLVHARSMKTDNGARAEKIRCKVGANITTGPSVQVSLNTYANSSIVLNTQPDGSAWDETAAEAMEIGIETN